MLTVLSKQRISTEEETHFRVLCVDDNRDAADSAATLLQLVGFEAHACYDAVSALIEAEEFHPDLCFIDLNMKGMDGDELAVRLRAAYAGRPLFLVALTAMSDDESHHRTEAAGFDLHMVKPADPFKLVEVVNTWFQTWNARCHPAEEVCGSDR